MTVLMFSSQWLLCSSIAIHEICMPFFVCLPHKLWHWMHYDAIRSDNYVQASYINRSPHSVLIREHRVTVWSPQIIVKVPLHLPQQCRWSPAFAICGVAGIRHQAVLKRWKSRQAQVLQIRPPTSFSASARCLERCWIKHFLWTSCCSLNKKLCNKSGANCGMICIEGASQAHCLEPFTTLSTHQVWWREYSTTGLHASHKYILFIA